MPFLSNPSPRWWDNPGGWVFLWESAMGRKNLYDLGIWKGEGSKKHAAPYRWFSSCFRRQREAAKKWTDCLKQIKSKNSTWKIEEERIYRSKKKRKNEKKKKRKEEPNKCALWKISTYTSGQHVKHQRAQTPPVHGFTCKHTPCIPRL